MSKVNIGGCKGIELCLSWRPGSNGSIPDGALDAGNGCYVARAKWHDHWTPGKLPKGHACAYVTYDKQVHPCQEYEVLVHSDLACYGEGHSWVQAGAGRVPERALVAGTDNVTPLFVARCLINGEVCTGKLLLGQNEAHFPWGNDEHKASSYEILLFNCHY